MTEIQANYILCPNYIAWRDKTEYGVNDSACFYLSTGESKVCELRREDSEHGGKRCPFAKEWE